MKNWKIIAITTTIAVLAVSVLASTVLAMGPFGIGSYGYGGGMMGGGYGYGGYGGMMGGYGYSYGYPTTATASSQYYQPVYPYQYGGGCMGAGFGGYGAYAAPYTPSGAELNITTAAQIGENYVASLGNPNLAVKEVEEYSLNFYVQVYEKNTGIGAFELLVNKYTGSIYPEMGPNMMWNTKYGMMRSGILGGIFGAPTADMPVNATEAGVYAQSWLNINIPGATVGEVFPFYGYYHVMAMVNGTNYGMMSVNGYTGQVWYHTWHGTFIQELDVS